MKSRALTGKVVIARRFSFIVAIYNYLRYQQYKTTASAPRIVVRLDTGARKRVIAIIFKPVDQSILTLM